MADVAENTPVKDAATAISQGKRHLLVRDYDMAVTVLARACELLVQEHGDTADELAELYLLYGRALLGLAREEAGVLGGGVPGSEETTTGQDEEDEDEEDEVDEKDEGDKEDEADMNDEIKKVDENLTENANGESSTSCSKELESAQVKDNEQQFAREKADDLKNAIEKGKQTEEERNEADGSKIEERKVKQHRQQEVPSCSQNSALMNGDSSNNTRAEEDDSEDIEKEGDEDDVNNLQIAWEILELAKLVILKRGPPGWKLLAECYRLLGEIAMEGGNHQGALTDLEGCMNLLQKITPRDNRAIAEIHYQLGLAHSLANDFDASIEQFNMATSLLEARIDDLQKMKDPPPSEDPFYTIEGEIQELKDLLPEIEDKIADIKDFKKEACRIKEIRDKLVGSCSNGAGPSDATPKPASDITHLIRKKRKAEEEEQDIGSPCKKPTPEKES